MSKAKKAVRPPVVGGGVERWHQERLYPRQVVIPETEEMKLYIEGRRLTEGVAQAVIGRELLATGRQVVERARELGISLSEALGRVDYNPGMDRALLTAGQKVADVALRTGWTVEQLLAQLEKVPVREGARV